MNKHAETVLKCLVILCVGAVIVAAGMMQESCPLTLAGILVMGGAVWGCSVPRLPPPGGPHGCL